MGEPSKVIPEVNDAFHGFKDTCQTLLEVVDEDQDFVGRFLSEALGQGKSAVRRALAGVLMQEYRFVSHGSRDCRRQKPGVRLPAGDP